MKRSTSIYKKVTSIAMAASLLGLTLSFAPAAQLVMAQASTTANGQPCIGNPSTTFNPGVDNPCIGTGGVDASGKVATPTQDKATSTKSGLSLIDNYANPLLNFLAAIVGLVVTIAIVVGGIQYASSADDPAKVSAAKRRISNAVIGMLAFVFLYFFLQWITPGGFL